MVLKIIGSNSKGNSYILENDTEALLIECGMKFSLIREAIGFQVSKFVGCLITHEHLDHCSNADKVMASGIDVYGTLGTLKALRSGPSHRMKVVKHQHCYKIGGFKVVPFKVKHDAADPCGFLIHHPETGNILFLTDSFYSPYRFKGLNNLIIEANFSEKLMDDRLHYGSLPKFLRNRILKSHMSIENCLKLLQANDLSEVNNIVLIHLSDANSDAESFKREVEKLTLKQVLVAESNMVINFDKSPF